MDCEYIAKKLEELADFRRGERVERQDFNGFSDEDDKAYEAETDKISEMAGAIREDGSYREKLQYLAADFDNYRKRQAKEKAAHEFETRKKLMLDVLGIVDDMERLVHVTEAHDLTNDVNETDMGFSLIYENMLKLLAANGCTEVPAAVNDKFDVGLHEAVLARPSSPSDGELYSPGSIYSVLQRGWRLDGVVIRPAKVVVTE